MFESFLGSRKPYFYSFIFVFLVGIFLVHFAVSGLAIYGDGIGYFAHLHTWVFDQDWQFDNEYKHIYSPANNNLIEPLSTEELQIVTVSPVGVAANHFFPGTALLLLPFYLLSDGLIQASNILGGPGIRNGYSDIYQLLVGIGVISYVTAGLYLLEKLLVKMSVSFLNSRISIIAIVFTTPLLYYGAYDVINSHGISFFLSSWFFYEVLSKKKSSSLITGIIVALAIMVRVQDWALAIIFLINEVVNVRRGLIQWRKSLNRVVLFLLMLLITLAPLYIYWIETFGSFSNHTYIQAFLTEHSPGMRIDWFGSLIQMKNGLFIRTPILLFASLGYVYLAVKRKQILVWQLLIFFILQYFIVSIQGGWTAAAFGGRMYISSLPFFAVILGLLLEHIKLRKIKPVMLLVILFFIINVAQIGYFVLFSKEAAQNKTGIEQRTRQRIQDIRGTILKNS